MAGDLNFEVALEKLEETVDKLERGELTLSESLDAFETGIKLTKFCSNKLIEVEAKIQTIREDNGDLIVEEYNYSSEGEE